MRIAYESRAFRPPALAMIAQTNSIIDEYAAQGFILTLRQLYYQFVARDLIPNTERSYKNLGNLVSKGRLAGMIDWEAIEDRTRNLVSRSHWSSPGEIVQTCVAQYRVDLWEGQELRPEVWIEKEALVGVIAGVCEEMDVSYFACRGYVSQSEQWKAGRRARSRWNQEHQETVILHLGDHDPSGIDMTRDNHDRLETFAATGTDISVIRLALNMDQIEEHQPPPNPTKLSDSRAQGYLDRFGESSWELDALEPRMIADLIRGAVTNLIDEGIMGERRDLQENGRDALQLIADTIDGE